MTSRRTEGRTTSCDVADGILVITINRPEVRNAIDHATALELADAYRLMESSDDISVGILTGAGGSFSSGMDLKAFLTAGPPVIPGRGFGGLTERPPRKPLIAAVEGYALAGGFEMVLACDLVVAADNAQFGLPEVTRGLVAGAGGVLRLPHRIPYNEAMRLVLTGDRLSAVDAHRYGLVTELVEPGQALEAARRLAAKIAANAPIAVRASKQLVVDSADGAAPTEYERSAQVASPARNSADAREGALAFTEKRPPVWTGR
jgi:enoyl-CoA hydratase